MPYCVPTALIQSAQVITVRDFRRWIEPWYLAYAILGALVSGTAIILIPRVIASADAATGETGVHIGLVVAAESFGELFAPFCGWLADISRFYRPIFFGGFLLISLGFLCFVLHGSLTLWVAGALLIGFGTAASNTVASLFIVEFAPATEWAERISWLQAFYALGSALGIALGGVFLPRVGILFSAALVIPAILVGGWGLPIPGSLFPMHDLRIMHSELATFVRRVEPMAASVTSWLHAMTPDDLRRPRSTLSTSFGLFMVGWFLFMLGISAIFSLYPLVMLHTFAMSPSKSSALSSSAHLLGIPLYNFAGRIANRRGPALILAISMIISAVVFGAMGLVGISHIGSTTLTAVILIGSFNLAWPLMIVASNDLSVALADFGRGTAVGLFNASSAVATGVGSMMGGVVADRYSYPSVGIVASLAVAAALGVVFHLRRLESAARTAAQCVPQPVHTSR